MTISGNISMSGINSGEQITNTKSKKEDGNNSFAGIMDLTANSAGSADSESYTDLKSSVDDVKKTDDNSEKYDQISENQSSDNNVYNSSAEKAEVDSTVVSDGNEISDEVDVDMIKEIGEIIDKLIGYIMDTLDIDDKKVSGMLQDLNLKEVDLLDETSLKNFILYSKDASEVDLLINEDLTKLVNGALDTLNNLLADFDNGFEPHEIINTFVDSVNLTQAETNEIVDSGQSQNPTNDNKKVMVEETNVDIRGEAVVTSEQAVSSEITKENTGKENHEGKKDDNLVNNLNQAIDNAVSNIDELEAMAVTDQINESDIIKQIIDDIEANVTRDTRSLEVKLNPENLGNVSITVTEKDGIMQAKIVAENETAKNAIEASLSLLKDAFDNHELKVDAIEVMIADYEFFNQNQDEAEQETDEQLNKNKITGINLDDVQEEDISEELMLEVELMKAKGNRVSYTI